MALSTALVSNRVWSQSTTPQALSTADRAVGPREWFQRGLAALDGRRFDDAIRAFERSYELRPSPVVLYNLGLALKSAGRIREAIAALERFLQHPASDTSQRELAAVRGEVERMRETLGAIDVDVVPRAARVVLDASEVLPTRGRVPVDPGSHTVAITLDGYRPESRVIHVARGRGVELTVELASVDRAPHLQVETDVANASVFVDGLEIGRGAIDISTREGEHSVLVRAPGFRELQRRVRVGATGSTRLVLSLQRDEGLSRGAVIAIAVGGAIAFSTIVGVSIGVAAAQPRAYEPPRTNPGWLGNTVESAMP
jgi:hypothetical protein